MEKTYPKAKAEKMATNEIGDSKNSLTLQYFSINKFLKNNNPKNDSSVKFNKLVCTIPWFPSIKNKMNKFNTKINP